MGQRIRSIPLSWQACCCVVLALVLAGCDNARQSVSDLVSRPSASEMVSRIDALVAQGQQAEALRQGEQWLKGDVDHQGRLHRRLADLYARAGDPDAAVRHLERAMEAEDPSPPQPSTGGTAAANDPVATERPHRPADTVEAVVPAAGARAGSGGVEARAGDAAAKANP